MKNEANKIDFLCKWVIIIGGAFLVALQMTGCNTVRGIASAVKGVATDIEAAADGIQHQMAETDQ